APHTRCPVLHAFLLTLDTDLRDRHSFPTRRSSDLTVGSPGLSSRVRRRRKESSVPGSGKRTDGDAERLKEHRPRRGSEPGTELSDRKSTRLNSSHVKISYAVFCMKKKKKEDACTYM